MSYFTPSPPVRNTDYSSTYLVKCPDTYALRSNEIVYSRFHGFVEVISPFSVHDMPQLLQAGGGKKPFFCHISHIYTIDRWILPCSWNRDISLMRGVECGFDKLVNDHFWFNEINLSLILKRVVPQGAV